METTSTNTNTELTPAQAEGVDRLIGSLLSTGMTQKERVAQLMARCDANPGGKKASPRQAGGISGYNLPRSTTKR